MGRKLVLFIHGFSSSSTVWNGLMKCCRDDEQLSNGFDFGTFDYSESTTLKPNWFAVLISLLTLGYSRRGRIANSIYTLADGLRTELEVNWSDYREVVLISHSMGGLVARQFLADETKLRLIHAEKELRVRGVMLLAVPNRGSDLANISRMFFRGNRQLQQLCQGSDFLESLNRDWEIARVSEQVRVRFMIASADQVVPAESARTHWDLQDVDMIIGKDHNTICEADSTNDLNFKAMKKFILACIAEEIPVATTEEISMVIDEQKLGEWTRKKSSRKSRLSYPLGTEELGVLVGSISASQLRYFRSQYLLHEIDWISVRKRETNFQYYFYAPHVAELLRLVLAKRHAERYSYSEAFGLAREQLQREQGGQL